MESRTAAAGNLVAVEIELLKVGDVVTIVAERCGSYLIEVVDPVNQKVLVSGNRYDSLPATVLVRLLEVGKRSSFMDDDGGVFGVITVASLSVN